MSHTKRITKKDCYYASGVLYWNKKTGEKRKKKHMKTMIVDIGSNTIKYDIFDPPCLNSIAHRSVAAGIIRYIENGSMTEQGLETLCTILSSYRLDAEKTGCCMQVFATASLRRVHDPMKVICAVKERTDIQIDLISGQNEAALSLQGMLAITPHEKRGLMMDMGGGSTELNVFENDRSLFSVSMPFGALSLKNEFVKNIFPDKSEFGHIVDYASSVIKPYQTKILTDTLYMVGGSAKAFAKLLQYKMNLVPDENPTFDKKAVQSLADSLTTLSETDKELLITMFPDRYHVILPALAAYIALIDNCSCQKITVSKGGIREGRLITMITQEENHERSGKI